MKCFQTTACLLTALLTGLQTLGANTDPLGTIEATFTPHERFDHTDDLLTFRPNYASETLSVSVDTVNEMPFAECLTLDVRKPGASPYAINLQFFHENHWKAGDTGLIAFWCRSVATSSPYGASSIKLQYKPSYQDWRGHAEADLYLEKEWRLFTLPFEVKIEAPETEQCVLNIFLGGVDPHTIQLARPVVYNFGPAVALEKLPHSKAYYPGMEPDAKWRAEALARIEQHRKADLALKITDRNGKPVGDAPVHVALKRHQFGFGAAIHTPLLVSPTVPEDARRRYSDILTRSCSKITPSNAMKWRLYEHFNHLVPDLIAWCDEHDMTLRGHLLIWPGFKRLPEGYDLYKTDPAAFRKDLVRHIDEFVNLFPNAFDEWDVLNEPYSETDFMDLLGKDVVLEWFETARKANPNFLTYINDYGILADTNAEHRDNYHSWISYLIENDAPLDGIGFQGHFRSAIPPELILERIDRFAAFGKKMQITEFDIDHADSELQARFFEDFVTLIYSHPQMSALINWIYLEDTFRPRAALYRKDFTPTAMGRVWERLLTRDWHTEETLTTDAEGTLSLRGFKGKYEITVSLDGKTYSYTLTLSDDLKQTLVIPPKED